MGNLRDKKGKFTSRKQPANGESISCSCFLYHDRYNLFVHLMFNFTEQKGQYNLFFNLITAILCHFKRIITPYSAL